MCGIVGFFGEGDTQLLDAMAEAIVHRGPDGSGRVVVGPAGLAMRRLAIIDLAGGQQPMASDDGALHLVFNGELYNYRELASRYLPGVSFHTSSDTEVVLRMYERLGPEAFGLFNGMYAIALWDATKGQLFLVRDRLGVKPLYYFQGARRLTFASELKALLQDPLVPRSLDSQALSSYLAWQYVPNPDTMLQGVKKLKAGHFLRLEAGQEPVSCCYWRPEAGRGPASRPEDFLAVIRQAVHRQMVSDVPVGAFLSGGLDSSLVVALMRERAGSGLRTFTAGFADPRLDESPWAARAAQHLGVDHEIVLLDSRALAHLPRLAWTLDEPVADRAALPTLLLAEAASRHVKVVLTGEGSDELFGGYPRYRLEVWAQRFHALPFARRRALWQGVLALLPQRLRPRVAKLVLSARAPGDRRAGWVQNFSPEAREGLLLEPHRVDVPQPDDATLASQLLLDMRAWLVDNVLMKVDKTTMAASLEARVPFLDHEVVDWALALPDSHKLRGGTTKHVVKQAALALLPAELVHRPKQGFHTPTALWFREAAGQSMLHDVLLAGPARGRGLFEPRAVERLVRGQAAGEDHDQALWSLVVLELWLESYLDRVPAVSMSA